MVFHFNPSLWFVCKLCRKYFPDTDKLKAHKLESHLGESLNIKCIVFEEKLLDHEWIPSSQEFASNHDDKLVISRTSTALALPQEQSHHSTNVKAKAQIALKRKKSNIKFKNPYVSLTALTAQELNSTSRLAASSKTNFIGGGKPPESTLRSTCNRFEVGGENKILLAKRKRNSVTEDHLSKQQQPKTEDFDDDDAHKNRIRELLSNVVLIKSEPANATDHQQVRLKPEQELPISIVSTYSLPGPSSATSKIINPVKSNVYFNSVRQQPEQHQLQLHDSISEAVRSSTSKKFNTPNTPLVSQIIPTFFKQQPYSYPVKFNGNGQPTKVGVKSESHPRYRYRHKISNSSSSRLSASSLPVLPVPSTSASASNSFTGKVEFIDSDLVEQNLNLETISVRKPVPSKPAAYSPTSTSTDVLQKPHVCRICSASFKKNHQLTQHLFIHSGARPFQCPHCDAKFKSKSNLRGHSISRHGQDSIFRCRYCGKSVPSRANLISHESNHTGFKHYKCDFPNCVEKFKCNASLYVHRRMVHGEELGLQQFVCPICGDKFVFQSQLSTHQNKEHVNHESMEILP